MGEMLLKRLGGVLMEQFKPAGRVVGAEFIAQPVKQFNRRRPARQNC